jgi:aryl-alcohol dehydrogenase
VRAVVLRDRTSAFAVEDIDLADPGSGEVLVEIVGAGLCHTDLALRAPELEGHAPIIPGHEGSGIVRAVGEGVTTVRVGDHVVMSFDSCGACRACRTGMPAYCAQFETRNLSGRGPDGRVSATDAEGRPVANRWFGQSSLAEFALATERNVVVVDPALPLELMGPLGCGLQTGAGSVLNEMRLAPGQSIAVFGAGAVGIAAVMAAKIAGASDIVVVDLVDARLDLARELGATRTVRGDEPDVVGRVRADGGGLDFALDTTGVTAVVASAVEVLARPGKIVLLAGGGRVEVRSDLLAGRTLTFAYEGSSVPQVFVPQLIEHWQAGRFPFERLVRTYTLDDVDRAEADSREGVTIKPVIITSTAAGQET